MKPDVFFENFELLADAPTGVQKLRKLILQLAVRGKLVSQDPNDEPASVLIEKIKVEKEKLENEGRIKKSKLLPSIDPKGVVFEVPDSWKLVSLSEVVTLKSGTTLDKEMELESGDIPYLKVADMNLPNNEKEITTSSRFVEDKEGIERYLIRPNSIIFPKRGGAIATNKKRLVKTDILVDLNIMAITCYDNLYFEYLYYWFLQINLWDLNNGTSVPQINNKDIEPLIFPLPPLAEQKRIVSKVDELMALCDKLEARRQKKKELQSKLNSAVLDRMFSAENQEEFEQYWQRICENFDLLYNNPENVGKLRQAILQLAVQGKLVEQDLEDEPASVLIEKIEAERERLVKKGEIKKNKLLPPIEAAEIPYDLPYTWEWVRVDQIAKNVEYGTSEKASEYVDGIPVLRMNNVQNGKIVYNDLKYLPESIKDLPRLFLKNNDLLFNRTNSYELVGKTGIFKGEDDTFTLASYLIRVSLFNEHIIPDFINVSLNSDYFRKTQIEPELTQQCGQANFNGTKLKNSLIPLPPLEEQKRIVEKVEQLMGLCDELESKLRKSREDSEKLMETVVKGLLEGGAAEI